jgi:hypothetical protein
VIRKVYDWQAVPSYIAQTRQHQEVLAGILADVASSRHEDIAAAEKDAREKIDQVIDAFQSEEAEGQKSMGGMGEYEHAMGQPCA